jgi:hypothetical protein
MAELTALLPAVQARRFYETIQAWALHARAQGTASTATTPGGKPSRAMNEYRADALTDLLETALTTEHTTGNNSTGTGGSTGTGAAPTRPGAAAGPGGRRRLRPAAQVSVTVGVQTLMALNEEPGHLDGYGPIPPEQARELAGTATSWLRILTHPEKGSILSIGRKRYKPSKDLRDWVINRDQVCRGIGCNRPARDCDLDHTIPFHRRRHTPDGTPLPRGETSHDNLGALCERCHHLKDDPDTGWTATQPNPGTFHFTTPTGRTYHRDPEPPPF